jgi:hypothetical protein
LQTAAGELPFEFFSATKYIVFFWNCLFPYPGRCPEIPIGTEHERAETCSKRISEKALKAAIQQVPQVLYIPGKIDCDMSALQQRSPEMLCPVLPPITGCHNAWRFDSDLYS